MEMQSLNGSMDYVNGVLQFLFQGHGIEAAIESDCVRFPSHPGLWANGELFRGTENSVQLDVRLGGFEGDRVVVESVGGYGPDVTAQARFAVESFANASFHVFLPAFFGLPPCHGMERETWTIGVPRAVYAGLITTVIGYPPAKLFGKPNLGFYPAFIKRLETYPLPAGTHWVRIYQARNNGQVLSNEVLFDNEVWGEMQGFMASYPWPTARKPYDVRVFLVIKDMDSLAAG